MIKHIYIERTIINEQLTRSLCVRFPSAQHTLIDSWREVFNAKAQNFRLQKKQPSAILAKKQGRLILPVPDGLSMGARHNWYFSHAYNCMYDCCYCFLQSMYSSAHYVFFVNHDDFKKAIIDKATEVHPEKIYFFAGYDCDSLAFEPITGFAATFVEVFRNLGNATLELRTKSTAIHALLAMKPCDNVVIAFSLSPDEIASHHDHKAPSITRRINAIARLADHGWQIGFRFDPLIWHKDFFAIYDSLCQQLAAKVPVEQRHSVTIGCLRFPKQQYKKMACMYPAEPWLATVGIYNGKAGYPDNIEAQLFATMHNILDGFIVRDKIFTMS